MLPTLHYAVVFSVIALIAGLFGFTGVMVGTVEIDFLFFVFLLLCSVSLIMGLLRRK